MGYNVAIVGATGNVGREMLNILEELNFPVETMHAVASRKSKGVEVSWGDKTIKCEDIEQLRFLDRRPGPDERRRRRLARLVREDRQGRARS